MVKFWFCWLALGAFLLSPFPAAAGGSGLNVVVVVNQRSTNSVELGNYYLEKREVPPDNLLRIHWPGDRVEWSLQAFTNTLFNPLVAMLAERRLTNQVDYVVLSMDIPYRVKASTGANSTTSALFYGFKTDGNGAAELPSCSLPAANANTYFGTEGVFRSTMIGNARNTFLVTMLTSTNLAEAKAIVDQGAAGDGTFPNQPAYLGKSNDRLRNVRYTGFDDAILNARLLNRSTLLRTNVNGPENLGYISGYANGSAVFNTGLMRFAPGSMADDLTSFSGRLYEPNDQTTLLTFLNAGACGSFGTVVEPCAHLGKFASPLNYFYQARGFSLAECYYQSVSHPYQGLLVGEPLSAPYAAPATGQWVGLPANSVLGGTTNLEAVFASPEQGRPVQQVDLFIDGRFARTLTNLVPQPGNRIEMSVAGQWRTVTVKQGATLQSLAAEVATALGSPSTIRAAAQGDRVELQGLQLETGGGELGLSVSTTAPEGTDLTTFVKATGSAFLDSEAYGYRSFEVTNLPAVGDYLALTITKTNAEEVVVAVTNSAPGTNLAALTRALIDQVHAHPALNGPDGVVIEDVNMHEDWPFNEYVYGTNDHSGEFNIRAVSPGWLASQIQARFRASPNLRVKPATTTSLDQNEPDLRPRAHVYLTAGLTNLPVRFNLDTTALPDGFHELTLVAYEGSHVRTQTRISRAVLIQNSDLRGTLALNSGGTNIPVNAPLVFSASANAGDITRIELLGTGGVLSTNTQTPAMFTVDSAALGRGVHRFAALLTRADRTQFRTQPVELRIGNALPPEPPFEVSVDALRVLSWSATPGRTYDVQRSTNGVQSFLSQGSVTADSPEATWQDPAPPAGGAFYRIRVAD